MHFFLNLNFGSRLGLVFCSIEMMLSSLDNKSLIDIWTKLNLVVYTLHLASKTSLDLDLMDSG